MCKVPKHWKWWLAVAILLLVAAALAYFWVWPRLEELWRGHLGFQVGCFSRLPELK